MKLDSTTEALLLQYFDAFSNLYGIISMKRALRIITQQNPALELSTEDFTAFINSIDFDRVYYIIVYDSEIYEDKPAEETDPLKKFLIANHLYSVDDDAYDEMKETQSGLRFHIPERDELLRYAEELYIERTEAFQHMAAFLKKEFHFDDAMTYGILEEWHIIMTGNTREDSDIECLEFVLNRMALISHGKFRDFKNQQQADRFIHAFSDLYNHTRLPMYRGHTPKEVNKAI